MIRKAGKTVHWTGFHDFLGYFLSKHSIFVQVREMSLRTFFDFDTLVLRSGGIAHLEDNVLEASGLSCWPMDSGDC